MLKALGNNAHCPLCPCSVGPRQPHNHTIEGAHTLQQWPDCPSCCSCAWLLLRSAILLACSSVKPTASLNAFVPASTAYVCSCWSGGTPQQRRNWEHSRHCRLPPLPHPQNHVLRGCSYQTMPQSALFAERSAPTLQWHLCRAMCTATHVYLAA